MGYLDKRAENTRASETHIFEKAIGVVDSQEA